MNYYHNAKSNERGVTMQNLKEKLYSLNMRMLLAIQYHDDAKQTELEKQIHTLQEDIERLNTNSKNKY